MVVEAVLDIMVELSQSEGNEWVGARSQRQGGRSSMAAALKASIIAPVGISSGVESVRAGCVA